MRTILDIGANNLDGFKLLSKIESIEDQDIKIFVEANPECWPLIESEICFIKNSCLLKKAVNKENGKATLVTRSDKKNDVAATIIGEKFLNDSLNRWGIKVNQYNRYEIETITILDIIRNKKIDTKKCILKLDAEGVEYVVLNQIMENDIEFEKIYCEFHIHDKQHELKKIKIINKMREKNQILIEWH